MRKLLCLLSLFVGLQAQASCREGSSMRVTILAESGCPSGVVMLNVETACVDSASPAFAGLRINKNYDACLESRLDSSGKFYQAYIFSASETK